MPTASSREVSSSQSVRLERGCVLWRRPTAHPAPWVGLRHVACSWATLTLIASGGDIKLKYVLFRQTCEDHDSFSP